MNSSRNTEQDISTFNTLGIATRYLFQSILVIRFSAALIIKNKKHSFFSIWYNLSFISLARWMALINSNQGTELESFLQEFFLIFRPSTLPDLCPSERISSYSYNKLGIKSNGFINNTKELMLVYLTVMIFYKIILIVGCKSKNLLLKKLGNQVKWNLLIRLNLIFLLDFSIFSAIEIFHYSRPDTCSVPSFIISFIFLGFGFISIGLHPVLIFTKLRDSSQIISESLESISTLLSEFKAGSNILVYLYYTIFIMFRVLLAVSFVAFSESPSSQIILISGFQFILRNLNIVFFLALVRPFNKKYEAVTVFITEIFVLCLPLLIGFRSADGFSSDSYFIISLLYIIFLYFAEGVIITRFFLVIFAAGPTQNIPNVQQLNVLEAPDRENSGHFMNSSEEFNKTIPRVIISTESAECLNRAQKSSGKHKIISPFSEPKSVKKSDFSQPSKVKPPINSQENIEKNNKSSKYKIVPFTRVQSNQAFVPTGQDLNVNREDSLFSEKAD